jgi:2-methylcitrate dehydratase PrpD
MRGTTGPRTVLEGRFGVYAAFVGGRAEGLSGQLADLGTRWETPNIAYKPYPACHFSHATLDAVRLVRGEHRIAADDVDEVVATVPQDAVSFVLEPAASKMRPRTEYEAKFSLQFGVAAMLVDGVVEVSTFTPARIADERLLDVARRVRYEVLDYPTYPAAFPGGARVRTTAGSVFSADLPHQRGSSANPMTEADIREKFIANARLAVPDDVARSLETALLGLDEGANLDRVLSPLGRAHAGTPEGIALAGR